MRSGRSVAVQLHARGSHMEPDPIMLIAVVMTAFEPFPPKGSTWGC